MHHSWLTTLRAHPAYRWCVGGLLAATIVLLAAHILAQSQTYRYGSPGTTDFVEYWTAGQLMLAGEDPYDFAKLYQMQRAIGSKYPWPIVMWNPPWLLVWLLPLVQCSFLVGAGLWFAVSFAFILASATLVWRTLARAAGGAPLMIAWIATAAFVPALIALHMGQMSSVLLMGVAGFLYCTTCRRDYAAGFFLALTTVKPHVAYLLWIAFAWSVIAQRQWRPLVGMTALLLPSLLGLTLLWPEWPVQYRAALANPPLYWQTPTLGGVLRIFVFTETPSIQFLPALVGGTVFLAYLLLRRPTIRWMRVAGPLLLLSVGTAPYGWSFDHTILLVPYLEMVFRSYADRRLRWRPRTAIITSLALIAAAMLGLNLAQVPAWCFVWVPWAFGGVYTAMWLAAKPAPPSPVYSRLAILREG